MRFGTLRDRHEFVTKSDPMSDDPLLSDDELRQRTIAFFRPVARQVLAGEFIGGRPDKLKFIQEMLMPLEDKTCQQAAGYLLCLLAAKTESETKL